MDKTQKAEEREHLEMLFAALRARGELIEGELEGTDEEPDGEPDFLLKEPKGVGIEVTRIFQDRVEAGKPVQAQESDRRWIVENAREQCRAQGTPPLCVGVSFDTNTRLGTKSRQSVSQRLAELVRANVPGIGEKVVVEHHLEDEPTVPEVVTLVIWRGESLVAHKWSAAETGFVAEEFAEIVQSAIRKKGKLIGKYLERCQRCWLLLVGESRAPSGSFAAASSQWKMDHCGFDRIFLVDAFSGSAIELTAA